MIYSPKRADDMLAIGEMIYSLFARYTRKKRMIYSPRGADDMLAIGEMIYNPKG